VRNWKDFMIQLIGLTDVERNIITYQEFLCYLGKAKPGNCKHNLGLAGSFKI